VFGAVHVEHVDWQTDAQIIDWMASHGVNRDEFAAAFNSFSMRSFVARGDQVAQAHKARSVPTLVVDGDASPDWMRNGVAALADILPNATHVTLHDQTHAVDPTVLAPLLEGFFAA
jgi:pimeloyl-ACP methyl ester carboxylesterase